MKIVIRSKNLKLEQTIKEYIREKLNSLERLAKIFQDKEKYFFKGGKPKIEAWVEITKTSQHHKKGKIFRAECQMRFPGKSIRSIAEAEKLRLAIVQVKDELQRQLKQYKDKFSAQQKRRQRRLKKEIRLSPRARFFRKGRIREEGI